MAIEVLPSDTLMECLKERADELGGQGINLFTNAVKKTQSKLLDFYIRPHLLKPDHSYIYIAEDKGKSGRRNYDPANTVAASINGNLALPGRWGLFTNPLEWVDINAIGPRPSDRGSRPSSRCKLEWSLRWPSFRPPGWKFRGLSIAQRRCKFGHSLALHIAVLQ